MALIVVNDEEDLKRGDCFDCEAVGGLVEPCARCGGSGLRSLEAGMPDLAGALPCIPCGGSGWEHIPCQICGGSGKIPPVYRR